MCSTRLVWPVKSAMRAIDGYFHSVSWFWLKPWPLSSSFSCCDHTSEQTCEPVSISLRHAPVDVFQKRMRLSAVPPPDASREAPCGHHATALTAAQ